MSRVSLSCFDIGNLSQQSARYLLFFIAFLSVVTCNESAIECFLLLWWLALYGVLFTGQEVTGGFSNYRLWESTGFLISYILQVNVCVDAKLWILISTLAIGMTGYLTVEYMEQESKQSAKREVDIQNWKWFWKYIFLHFFHPSCEMQYKSTLWNEQMIKKVNLRKWKYFCC